MIYVSDSNFAINYKKFNLGKYISLRKKYIVTNLIVFNTLFDAQFDIWFFYNVIISIKIELEIEINKKDT